MQAQVSHYYNYLNNKEHRRNYQNYFMKYAKAFTIIRKVPACMKGGERFQLAGIQLSFFQFLTGSYPDKGSQFPVLYK